MKCRSRRVGSAPPALLLLLLVVAPGWGCSKFDLLNATVPPCGYGHSGGLAYGESARQKLDVYRPRGVTRDAPVVVFFYGGSWQSGHRSDYRFVAQALTSRGFVVVAPDYRLYPQVRFPAFVEDGAAAVRWTRDHIARYGGDPDRIYLLGHSAGAHIVSLLSLDHRYLEDVGLDSDAIRATAALAGPYDFLPTGNLAPVFAARGSNAASDRPFLPIAFADGSGPPMLLLHGLDDRTVDPKKSFQLAARLRAAGGNAETLAYRDLGHVGIVLSFAWPFRCLAPTLRDVTAFFRQH